MRVIIFIYAYFDANNSIAAPLAVNTSLAIMNSGGYYNIKGAAIFAYPNITVME